MKKFTSLVLVGAIAVSLIPRPSQANPAVLAPAAFCAGTAGVGCVLVGVAVVGGISYYVWQHNTGKKVLADRSGQIFKQIDDPENPVETWEDYVLAPDAKTAKRKCQAIADKVKGVLVENPRYNPYTKMWTCKILGGNS